VVFIRKSPGRSGSTYIQIAERRDGRDVVLEHVGTARNEAELAVLLEIARAKIHPGQGELELGVSSGGPASGTGVITGKRSALLWQVLTHVYAHLGFDAIGDEAFKQLVLARLIEPTSKADSVRVLDEVGIPHASLRTIFRSLARAQERDYRSSIARACFEHASTSGDVSLCLYDVTTLYFTAEEEDTLRKVGYSKERRVDPQIVVGLLVDREGFPLEIGCFEGNHAETRTLIPIIEGFKTRHNLEGFVVVADAGMLSTTNLKALDDAGLRFIVGSRLTKAPVDLEAHFRWHGDHFDDGQVIDTITPKVGRNTTNDVNKRVEPVWNPDAFASSWRAVWAYSKKRAARDNKTITNQENRARAVIDGDKTPRTPRFVKNRNGERILDEAAITRARKLVGLKGYITNIPTIMMGPHEVITSYHDLWQVEASFRMSKTDLRARPIFHHTRDAIEAHLTIVFAALAIARYLHKTTGFSLKKLVRTLRPLQQIAVQIAGHEHTATDPLTPDASKILQALKLQPN